MKSRVKLRKHPFPYKASLSVLSDIDEASYSRFWALHIFINEDGIISPQSHPKAWEILGFSPETPGYSSELGGCRGLGLPLGDTFWIFDSAFGMYRDYDPESHTFVDGFSEGHNLREAILQWWQRGWVDVLHTIGPGDWKRDKTLPAIAEVIRLQQEHGLPKIRVWVNHSYTKTPGTICPSRFACQSHMEVQWKNLVKRLIKLFIGRYNFSPRVAAHLVERSAVPISYFGDTPDSVYYLNDGLKEMGIKFIWLGVDDPGHKTIYVNRIDLPEHIENGRSTILRVCSSFDDGSKYFLFSRVYGKKCTALGYAMTTDTRFGFDSTRVWNKGNLDRLCRINGWSILYTHWTYDGSFPLADKFVRRLLLLKKYYERGDIWIVSASKLLQYVCTYTYLNFESHTDPTTGQTTIYINSVDDPVEGRHLPSLSELDQITFLVDDPSAVRIKIGGHWLPAAHIRRNDIESIFSKEGSVTICA